MRNSHEIFRDRIQAWLSGQLDLETAAEFAAHQQECSECSALASAEQELWDMLGQGQVVNAAGASSIWPLVQERTFGGARNNAWFFGGGKLMRASLAACAMVAGLMMGALVPGLSSTASADEPTDGIWVSEASWLDASATDGLAGIWLDPGLLEESDGS